MSSSRQPPDDPREWLNRAHSNLVRAQAVLPGVYTVEEHSRAVAIAKAVVLWAAGRVGADESYDV